MKLTSGAKIDPALQAQIAAAKSASAPISAVIKLRPSEGSNKSVPPHEAHSVTNSLLQRVRENVGEREHDYFVLDMLGAFNLVAPASFVSELVKQPEVASAVSADTDEPAFIAPRNVKEVHLKAKTGHSRH